MYPSNWPKWAPPVDEVRRRMGDGEAGSGGIRFDLRTGAQVLSPKSIEQLRMMYPRESGLMRERLQRQLDELDAEELSLTASIDEIRRRRVQLEKELTDLP